MKAHFHEKFIVDSNSYKQQLQKRIERLEWFSELMQIAFGISLLICIVCGATLRRTVYAAYCGISSIVVVVISSVWRQSRMDLYLDRYNQSHRYAAYLKQQERLKRCVGNTYYSAMATGMIFLLGNAMLEIIVIGQAIGIVKLPHFGLIWTAHLLTLPVNWLIDEWLRLIIDVHYDRLSAIIKAER